MLQRLVANNFPTINFTTAVCGAGSNKNKIKPINKTKNP